MNAQKFNQTVFLFNASPTIFPLHVGYFTGLPLGEVSSTGDRPPKSSSVTLNSHDLEQAPSLDNTLLSQWNAGQALAARQLQRFSGSSQVEAVFQQAFGAGFRPTADLQTSWRQGVVQWPNIRVVSASQINGANGAFAAATQTIYVAAEFLERMGDNPGAIAHLLLEEYAHALDAQYNPVDAEGDEGAIFATLVQSGTIDPAILETLKRENDWAVINIDGIPVDIEQNIDVNQVITGLDNLLETLQNALENRIFAQSLPLLGDDLKTSTTDAVQFIENLRIPIQQALQTLNSTATAQDIADALATALAGKITSPIMVNGSGSDATFGVNLQEVLTSAIDLNGDFGLPNVGLELSGSALVELDYKIDLDFGINSQDGFYFDTNGTDDIILNLETSAPASLTGTLGVLEVEVQDSSTAPSRINGTFNIDLKDSDNKLTLSELSTVDLANLVDAKFNNAEADINLDLKTTVAGSNTLPSVGAELAVDWSFNNATINPEQPAQNFGNVPSVSFNNVNLYLGSFFSGFARPIITTVQDVLEPIQPVVDVLVEPIDLGVTKLTLLQIAKGLNALGDNPEETENFLKSLAFLSRFINSIPTDSNVAIPLGSLGELGDIRHPNFDSKTVEIPDTSFFEPSFEADSTEANFYTSLKSQPGEGLTFPILEDPQNAYNLLLGNYDQVELFEYDLPKFTLDAEYSQFFPIIGPLGADIRGKFGATIDVDFGFDMAGIDTLNPSGANPNFFDGFYIQDVDKANVAKPEVILNASLNAFASLAGAAGVGGGILGEIKFDLNDPTPGDGKVRYSEILAASPFRTGGNALFETSGQVEAGLSAYLEIKLGPFRAYTKRFDGPRQVLLDFGEESPTAGEEPTIVLATALSDGTLRLNMGPNAADRERENTDDGAEVFSVSQADNNAVTVSAFGESQVFANITSILANGGQENDVINLSRSGATITIPANVLGGPGQDELVGGDGADLLRGDNGQPSSGSNLADNPDGDRLYGHGGNDQLFGGMGDDLLYGHDGNDQLFGGMGNDLLDGGAGADAFDGGDGFDVVSYVASHSGITLNIAAGTGAGDAAGDTFTAIEQIDGSTHNDTLIGSSGPDILNGGAGNDHLRGGAGDDILQPGHGDDVVSGEGGNDVLVLDYSQLRTAAVGWKQTNPNNASESAFFVGNATGVKTPVKQLHPYGDSSGDGTLAIASESATVAWINASGLQVQELGSNQPPTTITTNVSGSRVSISADGRKVAWVGTDNNAPALFIANSDGTGVTKLADYEQERIAFANLIGIAPTAITGGTSFEGLTLAGDGTKVAWEAHWAYGNANRNTAYVGLTNTDGSGTLRSPFTTSDSSTGVFRTGHPSLSQDGRQITWVSQEFDDDDFGTLATGSQVLAANSDFTNIRPVSLLSSDRFNADDAYGPAISADGTKVAWNRSNPGGGDRLMVAELDNGLPSLRPRSPELLTGAGFYPSSLSANGELVAFGNRLNTDVTGLYVGNADGTGTPHLVTTWEFGSADDIFDEALVSDFDIGIRYGSFNEATGSGEIITWGASHVTFDSIERFDIVGSRYSDDLRGGNQSDRLNGGGGADTLQAGLGNDDYELDPTNASGSRIQDTGGTDTLHLSTWITDEEPSNDADRPLAEPDEQVDHVNPMAPTPGQMGIGRDNTTLWIDLNQDGTITAAEDLGILDFFATATAKTAGAGFIETVTHRSGNELLNATAITVTVTPVLSGPIRGTNGKDVLKGGANNDTLIGLGGNDRLIGNGGNDVLKGGKGNDRLFGNNGRDKLLGQQGNDRLDGGKGNDILKGGSGNDRLFGRGGSDNLNGGKGRDKLYGGKGKDQMVGGRDRDIFFLEKGKGKAIIKDFKDGIDRLKAKGIRTSQLEIIQRGNNTLINKGNDAIAVLQKVDASLITDADFI